MTRRVADVALDPRMSGPDALYTYADPGGLALGDAVIVPLGQRRLLGYVTALYEAGEARLGFALEHLRPVENVVEGLRLPGHLVETARWIADRYLCPLATALGPLVPPGAKDRLAPVWVLTDESETGLSTALREVVRTLRESGGEWVEPARAPEGTLKSLRALRKLGRVRAGLRVRPFRETKAAERLYRLSGDAARVEAFLAQEGRRRPAQALVLISLQEAGGAALRMTEIRALAGVTEQAVRSLHQEGLLEEVDERSERPTPPPTLNVAQALAVSALEEALATGGSRGFLLFGVTGSGKTEVFLRAAAAALREGKQVLYLVPEIALAVQAISALKRRFGRGVVVLHSEMGATERLAAWTGIREGKASVVVGPRSALFAPLENVGLIVVDEEHEGSYKQDNAPRYHARDVVRHLAERHGCPYVLGSATPSAESYEAAERDELTLLSLPHRAAAAALPEVGVADLSEGYRAGSPALFVPELHDALVATLEREEQAILFLNRRAYAPFLICRDCGHQWMCPHCSVSLAYHRKQKRLQCHQCGYAQRPPDECPQCGGTRIAPFGVGTEKVEEVLRQEFPAARVARLDRDVASRKGALEEVLSAFRARELDFLVGTQIVAKGLDFPYVTLVGVVAADVSLNLPDFRAGERTFQLLSQVAGRAGRHERPGRVIIQTFNPDHPSVRFAQEHDYAGFSEWLREERRASRYPPFCRLVNVVFTGPARGAVFDASQALARRLKDEGLDVLGPADCVLERLQDRWRRHLLIKLLPHGSVARIGVALQGFAPPNVQVTVDVDAHQLM